MGLSLSFTPVLFDRSRIYGAAFAYSLTKAPQTATKAHLACQSESAAAVTYPNIGQGHLPRLQAFQAQAFEGVAFNWHGFCVRIRAKKQRLGSIDAPLVVPGHLQTKSARYQGHLFQGMQIIAQRLLARRDADRLVFKGAKNMTALSFRPGVTCTICRAE